MELRLNRNKIFAMKLALLFCLPVILFASSCAACKEGPKQSNADKASENPRETTSDKASTSLYNTKWSLKKIYTNDSVENVQTRAFIRFDKEKGSAGGNGSCNSFGSNATVNGNELSFKNIFSTKMYCEAVQKIENGFLSGLEKITRFEIKDKSLLLYGDKELMLEFAAEEEKKSTE